MNTEEFQQKNLELGHAIQTGVKMEMELGSKDTEPKHLRVGVNMALLETGGIAKLLIDKGIITEEEYYDQMVKMMEIEVKNYEERLSSHYGTKITLA